MVLSVTPCVARGSTIKVPATQAVRKQAAEPAMKARMATSEMWPRLEGAMKLSAPICIPIEAGLEKPHSA